MHDADVKAYIAGLADLSTIPVLLAKIMKACSDESSDCDDLREIITYDPALAERVLRSANSVLFGHAGRINDIQQAILFLGFDRIKNIALGMTVMKILPSPGAFTVTNLWVHSYEVAFLASVLSSVIPMTNAGECFLAGLMHDIGRIVFYGMAPEKFMKIETTDTMLEQEQTAFGCTHAQAGAWLVESLGMPLEIAENIRHHHRPSGATDHREMIAVTALAEALSRGFSPRVEDDGIWITEHDALLLEFSITQDQIRAAGDQLAAASPEIAAMFANP